MVLSPGGNSTFNHEGHKVHQGKLKGLKICIIQVIRVQKPLNFAPFAHFVGKTLKKLTVKENLKILLQTPKPKTPFS
jgi:hypothetical protein